MSAAADPDACISVGTTEIFAELVASHIGAGGNHGRVAVNAHYHVGHIDGFGILQRWHTLGDKAGDIGNGDLSRAHIMNVGWMVKADLHTGRAAFVERVAVNANVEDCLASLNETPDFILADPPRAGLGKLVVKDLARIRAPRLTIVSCDPATLARDLNGLIAENYRIEKITLVDLFPQTSHLETVVELCA